MRSNQTSQSNETVQEGKICETLVTVEKPEMVGEMQYYDGGEKENSNSLSRLTFASQSNVTPYFDSLMPLFFPKIQTSIIGFLPPESLM